ncbi:MAG: hypothetical protein FWF77_02490 [Defluviitaleaceae bacterium]|nr:hypothetical protein [Defluviitaleaceae bacterium]
MNPKPTERVILVKGDATKWYNQAIFIVNKDMPATKMPVDFVAEAEKIIYNHIRTTRGASIPAAYAATAPVKNAAKPAPAKRKTSTFDITLNIMMILACVAIAAVFAYGMLA